MKYRNRKQQHFFKFKPCKGRRPRDHLYRIITLTFEARLNEVQRNSYRKKHSLFFSIFLQLLICVVYGHVQIGFNIRIQKRRE